MKKTSVIILLVVIMLICTSFGRADPAQEVYLKNNRTETIFVRVKIFDYLELKDDEIIKEDFFYTFKYYGFSYDRRFGGVYMGSHGVTFIEIPGRVQYPCYVYPSFPRVPEFHDIPIDEQFKKVYEEFTVYDKAGNELLTIDTITKNNFKIWSEMKRSWRGETAILYDWELVID